MGRHGTRKQNVRKQKLKRRWEGGGQGGGFVIFLVLTFFFIQFSCKVCMDGRGGATSAKVFRPLFLHPCMCTICCPTTTKELRKRIFPHGKVIFFLLCSLDFIAIKPCLLRSKALRKQENPSKYNNNPRMFELQNFGFNLSMESQQEK